VLSDIPFQSDPRVLIDFRTSDDAGVYAWDGGSALVQTVDFFTPIVDDPYVYGQIAAANSLSDVYAMGGRPLTALAIAAFPEDEIDAATIGAIFRGGFDVLAEAGVALLGGHTVRDREIKFGYAVTGAIDPPRIWSNAGARAGDVLLLTKAIGTASVGPALKFGRAPSSVVVLAGAGMRTLNTAAAEAIVALGVHACTDGTGFGLAGPASEMAAASGVSIALDTGAIPMIEGVGALVDANRPGGLHSNREHFGPRIDLQASVLAPWPDLLYDPQTSGGLLIALTPGDVPDAEARLADAGVTSWRVGAVRPQAQALLTVR
jgi:selenide,water dikinase